LSLPDEPDPRRARDRDVPAPLDDDIRRARRGDPQAIELLWRWLSPAVMGYFRSHGVVEAEDATSEVFLGVFQRLPRFRGGPVQLRTFVFSVAHARLVDHYRRLATRPVTVPWDVVPDRASALGDPAAAEASADARQLLAEVSVDQRDVLVLRIIADLSIEQTAAVLDTSETAVKALQHRALATLRRKLGSGVSP
jgi:RNA polymerase sigma-70 factor (ECF subfamily)